MFNEKNIILEGKVHPGGIANALLFQDLLSKVEHSIFRIIIDNGYGTGFFCKIIDPKDEDRILKVLFTCNHILNKEKLFNKKQIILEFNEKNKILDLQNRKIWTNDDKTLDYTCIEILKDDEIQYFLNIDENIIEHNFSVEKYKNKGIYIFGIMKDLQLGFDAGYIEEVENSFMSYNCNTESGFSGGPIINKINNFVIGIHKGKNKNQKYNFGIYIKYIINDIKTKNNYFKIDNNIKKENSQIKNNKNQINLFHNNTTNSNNFNNKNINFNNINKGNNNIKYIHNNLSVINSMNFYNNSSNWTLTRLKKEYKLCQKDEDLLMFGCNFGLLNDNIFNWRVTLLGPRNTPYEDGVFTLSIQFPHDYPHHGPEFKFKNRIYCLFVDLDINRDFGHINIGRLNEWRNIGKVSGFRFYTVKNALIDIFCCLYNQGNCDCFYDENMLQQYCNNYQSFKEEARKWTKKYASC